MALAFVSVELTMIEAAVLRMAKGRGPASRIGRCDAGYAAGRDLGVARRSRLFGIGRGDLGDRGSAVGVKVRGVATTALAACLAVAIGAGVVGAAPAPGGRIVFESSLPIYPLPDNFQAQRQFSIRFDGRARREIHPPLQWIWSRGVTRVFFARDGSMGAEVWAEGADGAGAHRLAVLRGSGRVESLDVSPDGSRLHVVAGALWVVGSDGSSPHTVFTPAAGSPVSSVTWSGDSSRLLLVSDGLWAARADGGDARRLFPRRLASRSATRRPLTARRSS